MDAAVCAATWRSERARLCGHARTRLRNTHDCTHTHASDTLARPLAHPQDARGRLICGTHGQQLQPRGRRGYGPARAGVAEHHPLAQLACQGLGPMPPLGSVQFCAGREVAASRELWSCGVKHDDQVQRAAPPPTAPHHTTPAQA